MGSFNSFISIFSEHFLFSVGILLVVGYYIGKLAKKVHLPEITGFIVAGLILGDGGAHLFSLIIRQEVLPIVPIHMQEDLKVITEMALGFIALTIGGEFSIKKLKRTGKEVIIITVVQILFTFLTVFVTLFVLKFKLPFSLLAGAIATATAPAATVAIVQSLRAHGLFVDYLYGVVALDDAGCVIVFGVIFSIVQGLLGGDFNAMGIAHAFLEVGLSILLGLFSGFLIHSATRKMKNNNEIMIISLGLFLFFTSISIVAKLSPLLTNMAAGAIIINLSSRNHRIFKILEPMTPPIYALFFVIAGTELQLNMFAHGATISVLGLGIPVILIFGFGFIIARAFGKYFGVYLGCLFSGIKNPIRKNLGFCMLPQAGVAIGLVLMIQASPMVASLTSEQQGLVDMLVNIVLLSVFVNELIGPPLSKMAIIKGNDMEI